MVNEQDDATLLEHNEDLAEVYVGGSWSEFKNMLTEAQSKVLIDGFNLILLSSIPEFDFETPYDNYNIPDTVVTTAIQDILIADDLDVNGIKQEIFILCINNIINLVKDLGVTLHEDEIVMDHLPELIRIAKLFYDLREVDELYDIYQVLSSKDIPPKERFINTFSIFYGEEVDTSTIEQLIEEVSEMSTEVLLEGINITEDDTIVINPPSIVKRIRDNKELLIGTLAGEHLINGGSIGGSLNSHLSFHGEALEELIKQSAEDDKYLLKYAKEVTGLFLISDINTESLEEKLLDHLYEASESITLTLGIDQLVASIKLD